MATTRTEVEAAYFALMECEDMLNTLKDRTGLSQWELIPGTMYLDIARAWSDHRQGLNTQALETLQPARALLTTMIARYA